jgi:hypothetical protein
LLRDLHLARRRRSAHGLVAQAALIVVAGVGVAGCDEESTPSVAAPANVSVAPGEGPAGADEPFVPFQRGDYTMVGPPVDASIWSLDIPSGGVFSGEASMFEFDQGEPDELVRRSIAVVTADVVGIGAPLTPAVGAGSEFPSDMSVDEFFGGQVMIPVRVRIAEVLAGAGVEAGAEYELHVGAVIDGGELLEFEEDRLPVLGESYLLFVDATTADAIPAVSGRLRSTGVGMGRIPLDEAEARGLLRPDRWTATISSDLSSGFVEQLGAESGGTDASTVSASPASPVEPAPAPESRVDAAVAFDVELVGLDLANLTATGMAATSVEVGGFWLIERWQDDRWNVFAHIGDSSSMSGTIGICLEVEGAEGCEQTLESRPLQPGQRSLRMDVAVGELPPGTYRVRLDSSATSTSDHLVVDSAGLSVVDRGT